MTRGKRITVAPGIYRDASGYAIITKLYGLQLERRYALDSDLDKLKAIRANWIVQRKTDRVEAVHAPHSFARAVQDYLRTLPHPSRRHTNAVNDLGAWLPAFKHLPTTQITAALIKEQIARWLSADPPPKPSTINHRRQELKNLFAFLRGPNPVTDVPKLRERYDDARAAPPEAIEAIFSCLPKTASALRLRVIYETALPHSDLSRLTRATFHPKAKTIAVPARRKGAGSPAVLLSLTSAGVRALTAFFDAGLEGKVFSNSTLHRDFTAAVVLAKATWIGHWPAPANFHPYDLRHSRLTEALRRSKNLQGVQQLARHTRLETTMRYVRALEADSMKQVAASMEPDGTVPAGTSRKRENRPKRTAARSRRARAKTR